MKCKVGDICLRIGSGGTPSRKNMEYYSEGKIKWLKTKELEDKCIYDTEEHITEEAIKGSSAKLFPKNTVTMAMYGATVGKLGILKEKMATNQACCNMVVNENKCDYRFLFYLLLINRNEIINLANGAAQQNLNKSVIENFEIDLLDIDDQRKVADILWTLDRKIELNNEMNKTLEEMAQALFKRWFVDFEFPNEDGEPYKSSSGEMIESEFGMIPKGWDIKILNDLSVITMGVSPSSSSYNDENIGLPLLNGAADFQGKLIKPSKYTSEPKKVCNIGDMVFGVRATIGNTVFADGEYALGRGVAAVKPNDDFYREFVYFTLNNSMDKLISSASGSVFLNLKKADITDLQVCINDSVIKKYHSIASNLINKVIENDKESEILKQKRDSLLPKLMSGEIRVEDIEANL